MENDINAENLKCFQEKMGLLVGGSKNFDQNIQTKLEKFMEGNLNA
jgi:hypothetical protein